MAYSETGGACSKCGVDKPAEAYPKGSRKCRVCHAEYLRQYRLDNKAVLKDKQRQKYQDNAPANREAARRYRANNRDAINARRRELRRADADAINAAQRERYANDADYRATRREYDRAYRARHTERIRARDRARNVRRRAQRQAYNKQYYAANKDRLNTMSRAWYVANQGRIKVYRKRYYAANRESLAAYQGSYRAAHREEINARARELYAVKGDGRLAKGRRRQARIRLHTNGERPTISLLLARNNKRCYLCGVRLKPSNAQIEHVRPISKGGRNTWANTQPACQSCNLHKSATEPEVYAQRTGVAIQPGML